jgi:plastocyanin
MTTGSTDPRFTDQKVTDRQFADRERTNQQSTDREVTGREASNRRTFLRASGVALATVATAGCVGEGSSATRTVEMTAGFGFAPKTVTVEVGETVTWTNESDVGHTVTAYEDQLPDGGAFFASGGFESESAARTHVSEGLVGSGGEYEHTFDEPGTYDYYCIPHESSGMVGTVRVE